MLGAHTYSAASRAGLAGLQRAGAPTALQRSTSAARWPALACEASRQRYAMSGNGKGGGAQEKLKLLCLHGYLQNAEIFRTRIGSLRKGLKSRIEFVFIDAPFEAQGLPDSDPEEVQGGKDGRSWWQWTDTGPAGRPSKAANYTGWEVTYQVLLSAIREHRPDGVLGFSQGATATALLLASMAAEGQLQRQRTDGAGAESSSSAEPLPPLRCAVMVAGFLPRDPSYAELASNSLRSTVPCLFVTGTADALVPPERTQQLVDCFPPSCASLYQHNGAHLVPTCTGDFKAALVEFLDSVRAGGTVPPFRRVQRQSSPLQSADDDDDDALGTQHAVNPRSQSAIAATPSVGSMAGGDSEQSDADAAAAAAAAPAAVEPARVPA